MTRLLLAGAHAGAFPAEAQAARVPGGGSRLDGDALREPPQWHPR